MLGFVTRILVLALGYAYPAFECYKTVEKNRVEIEELRFWCQYWIIAAILTVLESVADIFISWVPMYGEMKLGLFIYLWYPKTKGSSYVYESVLRPYVSRHETDIDRKLLELRARAWDLAIFYWKNCTEMGMETFFQTVKFLAAQSAKVTNNSSSKKGEKNRPSTPPPPPPFFSQPNKQQSGKKRPPMAPPPGSIHRAISEPAQSNLVQVEPESQTETLHTHESMPNLVREPATEDVHETTLNGKLHAARLRLRRQKL